MILDWSGPKWTLCRDLWLKAGKDHEGYIAMPKLRQHKPHIIASYSIHCLEPRGTAHAGH